MSFFARFLLSLTYKQAGVKQYIVIIIGLLFSGFTHSQTTGKQNLFAVGLFTSAHSQMITYAIVSLRDGQLIGAQVLTEQQFMYQAMGYYPSIANLGRVNLFEKNGVDSCFLYSDEDDRIVGYYCQPFTQLWKIRFYENPYEFDVRGWSQGQFKPSRYQSELILKEYGVKNVLTDYFYGDTLYKLLRDVQDPVWVETYRFISPDTTNSTNSGQP